MNWCQNISVLIDHFQEIFNIAHENIDTVENQSCNWIVGIFQSISCIKYKDTDDSDDGDD